MFKNKKVSLIIISALALTLALGLVAFNSVSAAGSTDGTPHRGGPGGFRPGPGDETYLADALGISAEELQAAYADAQAAAVDQALAEGLITQAQADRLTENGFGGFQMLVGPDSTIDIETLLAEAIGISMDELSVAREGAKAAAIEQALADGKITEQQVALMDAREALNGYVEKDALLADALGLTPEELAAAQEEGQRIPDLLEELGMTQEDFDAAMQAAHQEALAQAVADGVITQEQADLLAENDFSALQGQGGRGDRGGQPRDPGNGVPGEVPEGFPRCPGGQQPPVPSGNGG
jgi:hypothetical protein